MPRNSPSPISASLCDVAAAAAASLAIAPLVAVVDASVVQLTASHERKRMRSLLWANLRPLIRSPVRFLASRTTRLLFTVYFGTYATANILDSIADCSSPGAYGPVAPSTVKLVGVSAVSTGLTVYKDSCLAKMFGAVSRSRQRVPSASYLLFTARDVLTIYGCIVLPPVVARRLDDIPGPIKDQFSLSSLEARTRAAQLLLPLMVQFVSTPIHLLALDLYNRQNRLGLLARLARVKRDLPPAVPTRMLRILPAFGVGGLLNTEARGALQQIFAAGDDRGARSAPIGRLKGQ